MGYQTGVSFGFCERYPDLVKGALAGAAGGLAGSLVMSLLPRAIATIAPGQPVHEDRFTRHHNGRQEVMQPGSGSTKNGSGTNGNGSHGNNGRNNRSHGQGEQPGVAVMDVLSRTFFHHHLSEREKKIAGPAAHLMFGVATGAAYGMLAETSPALRAGFGMAYGSAVWLAADEVGLPMLGLVDPPNVQPARVQAQAFGMHLLFGATLEAVRAWLRERLDRNSE